jgi:hypothetical protein
MLRKAINAMGRCSSLADLQKVWTSNIKVWKDGLGPIEIRKVVFEKEGRKLELAKKELREGRKDMVGVFTSCLTGLFAPSPALDPAFEELAASGLTDMDVADTTEAIFLFALNLVRSTDEDGLVGVWDRHSKFWHKRMPKEAFAIVNREFRERLGAANVRAFDGARDARA